MKATKNFNPFLEQNPLSELSEYLIDASQRMVLFWDAMRQRGNQYLEHRFSNQKSGLRGY